MRRTGIAERPQAATHRLYTTDMWRRAAIIAGLLEEDELAHDGRGAVHDQSREVDPGGHRGSRIIVSGPARNIRSGRAVLVHQRGDACPGHVVNTKLDA